MRSFMARRADAPIDGLARRAPRGAAAALMLACGTAWAQGAATPDPASTAAAGQAPAAAAPVGPAQSATATVHQDAVVVTGSRTQTRASQSLTPVDVIGAAQLQQTGAANLRDALVRLSPSITRESYAGDTAVLSDVLSMHGLTPDHVLVLVNGKRRHTTANISLDGGLNQGATGVDISTIPVALIDHIEVLRDGAAAQYGSDAIAGVINIILKRGTHGGSVESTNGKTYAGDGFRNDESAVIGFDLGGRGFLDLSAGFARQNHTVRTGPDDYFGRFAPGQGYANPIEGDPASTRTTVGFNAGYYLTDEVQLYGFGTFAHRRGEAYQNYRPPSVLPGVFPNGFVPVEAVSENDFSVTAGLKGENLFGFTWDLSSTYGGDYSSFGLLDSANTGLYAASGDTPTDFHLSTLSSTQLTNNLDLSRAFHLPLLAAPLTVSFGVEQRHETYSVAPGDYASYILGGAQALPGLAPVSASRASRDVLGTYVDLATRLTPRWKIDVAGRFEHYSDVGDTANGKFATRYELSPAIALRGSISSGFRAPSLAEENYTNVNTSPASANGLLAANSSAARLIGAQPLKSEKSTNLNLGLVLTPTRDLNVAIDAYQIDIRNRIVEGGTASGAAALAALQAAGLSVSGSVPASAVSASYFTNGADTRTRGLDLTGTYQTRFGQYGRVDWDLGVNFNTTSVTRAGTNPNGTPQLNAQQIAWLTTSTPKNRIIVGGTWHLDKWAVSLHETRFGPTTSEETYIVGPNAFSTTQFVRFQNAAKYTTDLEVRYDVTPRFQIAIGAINLFDAKPSELPYEAQLEGIRYDSAAATIGANGGFYYARARYAF
ncbi:TonB-dependent receptor plug domain-containing protein [Burkholderia perseverans]|uniref:TonB-dependent receptor plug domain-containing protein n=1 Tax=Burkholderia perseverans TaxID=2615214 RepID=UPI003CC80BBA